MENGIQILQQNWENCLRSFQVKYLVYATIKNDFVVDYELLNESNIANVVYNNPKPISPLKQFFLSIKEDVTQICSNNKIIILGASSCDLDALNYMDEVYLEKPDVDKYYEERRKNTILIGAECFSIQKTCHCNRYSVKSYPTNNSDVTIASIGEYFVLKPRSEKGKEFIAEVKKSSDWGNVSPENLEKLEFLRAKVEILLDEQNKKLPDYPETGKIVQEIRPESWEYYANNCVACGACTITCPTCSCFLLTDKIGLKKIRQLDACQYPGFARFAAREVHLRKRSERFKNRYMCIYVWKPENIESLACTGCGRCIDTCIGNIDKNEIFIEQNKSIDA